MLGDWRDLVDHGCESGDIMNGDICVVTGSSTSFWHLLCPSEASSLPLWEPFAQLLFLLISIAITETWRGTHRRHVPALRVGMALGGPLYELRF